MCGSGRVDDTAVQQAQADAAAARAAEEARKARIEAGTQKVDQVFSGFTDPVFQKRRADFMAFYQPQIDDQFKTAKDDLTFALNDAGLLNSTVAGDRVAKLGKSYDTQLASTMSKAEGEVNDFRNQVADQKSLVISQLNATSDADRAATEALSRQQVLANKVPAYSPIGDIFGGLSAGIGAVNQNNANNAVLAAYSAGRSPRRSAMTTVGG